MSLQIYGNENKKINRMLFCYQHFNTVENGVNSFSSSYSSIDFIDMCLLASTGGRVIGGNANAERSMCSSELKLNESNRLKFRTISELKLEKSGFFTEFSPKKKQVQFWTSFEVPNRQNLYPSKDAQWFFREKSPTREPLLGTCGSWYFIEKCENHLQFLRFALNWSISTIATDEFPCAEMHNQHRHTQIYNPTALQNVVVFSRRNEFYSAE